MNTDAENAVICMNILIRAVGKENAERFVTFIRSQAGDYTLERRRLFDDLTNEELRTELKMYASEHPNSYE